MDDDEEYALPIYQALRVLGQATEAELAAETGLDRDQVGRGAGRLRRLGLVRDAGGVIGPVEPSAALMAKTRAHQSTAAAHAASAGDLEQLAHALLTLYQPTFSVGDPQAEVELITEPRLKDRRLRELHAVVRTTCDSLHPGWMPPIEVLNESLEEDAGLIARGVRLRSIYGQAALENPKYARYLHDLSQAGVELRLIDHAAYDLLIFDRLVAFSPAAVGTDSRAVVLLRGAALVNAQAALYEDYWLRAVPYRQAVAESERTPLGAQERAVVRLMSSGLSDDQIARKLGVHRRTVQRAVAKLMERLGASSRFEAGLKLARAIGDADDLAGPSRNRAPRPRPQLSP
jgi:DNA-binding CsgD family transcriptional regulator